VPALKRDNSSPSSSTMVNSEPCLPGADHTARSPELALADGDHTAIDSDLRPLPDLPVGGTAHRGPIDAVGVNHLDADRGAGPGTNLITTS